MKKITTLIVSAFFVFNVISAQSESLNATVLDKDGQTIAGVIDYKQRGKSPSSIPFKAKDAPAKILYPIDIQGFAIESKGEKYISAIIDLNRETLNEPDLNQFKSMKEAVAKLELVRDTVFLLTLVTGEINLYSLIDENYKRHFFYQKGNAPIKELIYRKIKIITKEREKDYQAIGEIKAFAVQLKMDVLDCPNVFSMIKEETFHYKASDLMRVVSAYNQCKGKSTFIMPVKKKPIIFYALAGINKVQLSSRLSLGYRKDENPISSINPVVGLGIDAGLGRRNNGVGIGFEMLYKPIKASLKSESDQSGFLNTKEFNFDMTFLQLNALFRYNIYLADYQPYVKAGLGLAILTNTANSLTEITGFNNVKRITTPAIDNGKLNVCFALGTKKNKFHLEGRYDLGFDRAGLLATKLKSNYISLLFGYSFFSNK
jgi:hypothetical protein